MVAQGEANTREVETGKSEASPVTARELKILLATDAFAGDPDAAAAALEAEVLDIVENDLDRDHDGSLAELDKERTVHFLDVPGSCALRRSGWAFRSRVEDDEREVTLKFRSLDRYLAADADVTPSDDSDSKTKLEEDIKPPYTSVFSRSTKLPVPFDATFATLQDVAQVFPSVSDLDLDMATPLEVVSDLHVYERVYGELEIDLGKLDAEMGITLWYASADDAEPAVAELSFKYKSKTEDFQTKSVRRAKQLFDQLQALPWVAENSTTKTAFAYGYDPSFCGESTVE
jgi:hypothetical protein